MSPAIDRKGKGGDGRKFTDANFTPRFGDGRNGKHTHGRYASYWNVVHNWNGHAWQGRYYSCPLDRPHLWEALRYTELNPMRAKLVTEATSWAWSSAAAHCGVAQADTSLSMEPWQTHWTNTSWREYLAAGETETELTSIRQSTHTGRPLGTQEFVHALESATAS